MVVDLGTGAVRHVDISWPGDVPRGSHVIRRRSGLMSPHSSFDLPDEDSSRRTSVHFDPVQLERAVSDILLEEDTTEESEDTSTSPPIVKSRLEFSTSSAAEIAPINELRQETEPLPGNRLSLASRTDIVGLKTPAAQTDHAPKVPLAESDSLTFSENFFAERFIHPVNQSSPQYEFIRDSTLCASSLSTKIPQLQNNFSEWKREQSNNADISSKTTISKINLDDEDESSNKSEISSSCDEVPSQGNPPSSPAASEMAISSLTEISGSISTKSLLLDEMSDKSQDDIPEDLSLRRSSVDKLESIEELIKSTNNIILCHDSEPLAPGEVQRIVEETKVVLAANENETAPISPVSNEFLAPSVAEAIPTIPVFPVLLTESEAVQNDDSEVEDSDNSAGSVFHAPSEKDVSSDKLKSTPNSKPADLYTPVSSETPSTFPEILDFPTDAAKSLLRLPAGESEPCNLPEDALEALPPFSEEIPLSKGESGLGRGLSHESTISVDSVESSTASTESQVTPSLPPLEGTSVSELTKNCAVLESASEDGTNELNVVKKAASKIQIETSKDETKQGYNDCVNNAKEGDSVSPSAAEFSTADSPQNDSYVDPVPEKSLKSDILDEKEPCLQPVESNETVSMANTVNASSKQLNETTQGKSIVDSEHGSPRNDDEIHKDGLSGDHVIQKNDFQSETFTGVAPNGSTQEPDRTQDAVISSREQELNVTRNDIVKRKSLIETENIVISTHQIGSDEHVSAQQATQSDLAHSATVVEREGTAHILQDKLSPVYSHILPGDTREVKEGDSSVESEDACVIEEDGNSDEQKQGVDYNSSIPKETPLFSSYEETFEQNTETDQALEAPCDTYEAEASKDEEETKPTVPGQKNEQDQCVETPGNAAATQSEGDDCTEKLKLDKKPTTTGLMSNIIKEAKPDVLAQEKVEKSSVETSRNATGNDAAVTQSERDDGPKKPKSSENPTPTDRSNASEVKQEMKSVSSIEDIAEIVKVAPSAPSAPQMEDIPAPTVDTSPNKAFWVRD